MVKIYVSKSNLSVPDDWHQVREKLYSKSVELTKATGFGANYSDRPIREADAVVIISHDEAFSKEEIRHCNLGKGISTEGRVGFEVGIPVYIYHADHGCFYKLAGIQDNITTDWDRRYARGRVKIAACDLNAIMHDIAVNNEQRESSEFYYECAECFEKINREENPPYVVTDPDGEYLVCDECHDGISNCDECRYIMDVNEVNYYAEHDEGEPKKLCDVCVDFPKYKDWMKVENVVGTKPTIKIPNAKQENPIDDILKIT